MNSGSGPIGIIAGSGFTELPIFEQTRSAEVETPYGKPSAPLITGSVNGQRVIYIARHGIDHSILPHLINYRANLWAFKQSGVDTVIAVATVGGIGSECGPGTIVIPDQILDYTHSREHTYSPLDDDLFHIDFTEPYCSGLRDLLIQCGRDLKTPMVTNGTYAATQGPRFESAAEINRLENDGALIVGMTGMPETSLAREAGICYATIALVVNYAAGRSGARISTEEINDAYAQGSGYVHKILNEAAARTPDFSCVVPPAIRP